MLNTTVKCNINKIKNVKWFSNISSILITLFVVLLYNKITNI